MAALSLTLTSPAAQADGEIDDEVTAYCQGDMDLYEEWDGLFGSGWLGQESKSWGWEMVASCVSVRSPASLPGSFPVVAWAFGARGEGVGTCESFEASGATYAGAVLDNMRLRHDTGVLSMKFDYGYVPGNEHDFGGSGDMAAVTSGPVCLDGSWPVTLSFSGVVTLARDDVEQAAGLLDLQDPEGRDSDDCRLFGGERVVDNTVLGVRQWVYVHQPTADQLWICARVEDDTGEGYGGRLEVTPTGLDPQVTGGVAEPEVDSASTACTTTKPNDAPGTRPIAFGGVGPVDYMLDAFLDGDEAWLCLQVDSTDTRVVVPLGGDTPGVSFGSVATWWPDEGTPTL